MSVVDVASFVETDEEGRGHLDLAVEGIDCAACIGDIEGALSRLPGIAARVNYTLKRVGIEFTGGAASPAMVMDALERRGYRAHPYRARSAESAASAEMRRLLRCLAVAGFAAMNIMLLSVSVWSGNATDITAETRDVFHWLSALIALPAAAVAGQPFFSSAIKALRTRRMNMDVPISLGVCLALGVSVYETAISAEHAYFDSAVMLLFFLLAGRTLEQVMRRKTRAVAGNLAALKAPSAERETAGGAVERVPAEALAPGDVLVLRPGDRLPADGRVVSGASEVDEGLITGESAPRAVAAGDLVYAGTVNLGGLVRLEVTAAGRGTLLDEIERLLDGALETRSARVALADRAARLYAPVVHATAALSAIGWLIAGAGVHTSLLIATTVLIITCPCALALAVPAVQVVAAGTLFRRGVFLNAGDAIERLAEADTVVFDKTGTLTLPEPACVADAGVPPELLALAARLAAASRHPLARAVAAASPGASPVDGAVEEQGAGLRALVDGVEARLGSPAFCGVEAATDGAASLIAFRYGTRTALLRVAQRLRPDAAEVVRTLQRRGYRIHILSGDRQPAVDAVAGELGVADARGGLKPADKIAVLQELAASGRRVVMVGDGLNDAPALAAAHVSISPISAADLTQAHADAVFLGDRLAPVGGMIAAAVKARRLMTENLWISVVYNAIAVPLAIAGWVTPLIAALAMSGSSLIVTLNALRARDGQGAQMRGPRA